MKKNKRRRAMTLDVEGLQNNVDVANQWIDFNDMIRAAKKQKQAEVDMDHVEWNDLTSTVHQIRNTRVCETHQKMQCYGCALNPNTCLHVPGVVLNHNIAPCKMYAKIGTHTRACGNRLGAASDMTKYLKKIIPDEGTFNFYDWAGNVVETGFAHRIPDVRYARLYHFTSVDRLGKPVCYISMNYLTEVYQRQLFPFNVWPPHTTTENITSVDPETVRNNMVDAVDLIARTTAQALRGDQILSPTAKWLK